MTDLKYVSQIPRSGYSGRWPKKVLAHNFPPGYLPRPLGEGGFRAFWTDPDPSLEICRCGWAPHLVHYSGRNSAQADPSETITRAEHERRCDLTGESD